MKKIITTILIISSFALFSCKTTNEVSNSSKGEVSVESSKIEGEWKLSKLVLNGAERNIYPSTLVVSKEGEGFLFAGSSGVNQYTGSVSIDKNGNIVVTAPYASTKMAGPTELMEFEDDFLRVLSFAGKVNLTETLELLDLQSESKLIFTK